jgi:hypothetical protein
MLVQNTIFFPFSTSSSFVPSSLQFNGYWRPVVQWVVHTAEHSKASSAKVTNTCSYSLNHFQRAPFSTIVNVPSVSHFIGLFHAQTLKRRLMKPALCTWWTKTHTPNTVTNYISGPQPVGHKAIPRELPVYSMGHKTHTHSKHCYQLHKWSPTGGPQGYYYRAARLFNGPQEVK